MLGKAASSEAASPGSEIKIYLDGNLVQSDVPAYLDQKARTQVPLRFIAKALGGQVFWDKEKKEVGVQKKGVNIQLWIGKTKAIVNGEEKTLDTVPVLRQGRTFVPLRFIAETFSLKVTWQQTTQTVALTTCPSLEKGIIVCQNPASKVRLRSGPGLNFEILTTLTPGTPLEVLEEKGGWYRVRLAQGLTGWIHGDYVKLTRESPPSRSEERPPGTEPGTEPEEESPEEEGRGGAAPKEEVPPGIKITKVTVKTEGDGVTVHLEAPQSLPFSPPFRLRDPERIVVDFSGTCLDPPVQTLFVEKGPAEKIRLAQFTSDTVRLVVDLQAPAILETLTSEAGFFLTLKPPTLKGKTVVLDAGHGSLQPWGETDPGAIGPSGLKEEEVNLDIALRTGALLKAEGINVIYTREGPTSLSLEGRAAVAAQKGADVFVSVHANASPFASTQGTMTIYYAPRGSNLEEQREKRIALAQEIQNALVGAIGRLDLGTREMNFAVLRTNTVPSALVEVAFLSNPEEEALLADPAFRQHAAQGIATGIMNYLLNYPT